MSKSKHTPGPWSIGYGRSYRNTGIFEGGPVDRYGNANAREIYGPTLRLATLEEAIEGLRTQATVDADARLIASAPELLEACRMAHDAMLEFGANHPEYGGWAGVASALASALRKATGEEG